MVEDLAVSVARSHLPGAAARGQALAQVRVPVNWIAPPPTLRKPSRTHSAKASAGPCCAANVDTSRRGPCGERRTPWPSICANLARAVHATQPGQRAAAVPARRLLPKANR
jgi:hypothetical protein